MTTRGLNPLNGERGNTDFSKSESPIEHVNTIPTSRPHGSSSSFTKKFMDAFNLATLAHGESVTIDGQETQVVDFEHVRTSFYEQSTMKRETTKRYLKFALKAAVDGGQVATLDHDGKTYVTAL